MTTTDLTTDTRLNVLSILGQQHSARTSELMAATGATRADVLKALRSLERRDGCFKARNDDFDYRSGSGRYTDALWVINGEPCADRFADLQALNGLLARRGNLFDLMMGHDFVV